MNNKNIFWIVVVLMIAAVLLLMAYVKSGMQLRDTLREPPSPNGVMCTMEAMQCPDGSYVGRQGPNCEFAPCP